MQTDLWSKEGKISNRVSKYNYLILLIPLLLVCEKPMGEAVAVRQGGDNSSYYLSSPLVTNDSRFAPTSSLDSSSSVDRGQRQGSALYKQLPSLQRRERAIIWGIILGLVLGTIFLCLFGWFILKVTKFGKK